MIPFDMHCPECSNSLRVSDPRLVGHHVKCPKCKHRFAVTAPPGHDIGAANGDAHREVPPPDRLAARSAPPPGAVTGDVHRLRTNGAEAAAELTDFLRKMRGKSPQEMLGLVAQSSLVQGVVQATVWTVVLMAILTVVPYGLAKAFPTAPTVAAEVKPSTPAAKSAAPAATDTASAEPTDKRGKVLKQLGEDETKATDPKLNPLENAGDDLLKDLK